MSIINPAIEMLIKERDTYKDAFEGIEFLINDGIRYYDSQEGEKYIHYSFAFKILQERVEHIRNTKLS